MVSKKSQHSKSNQFRRKSVSTRKRHAIKGIRKNLISDGRKPPAPEDEKLLKAAERFNERNSLPATEEQMLKMCQHMAKNLDATAKQLVSKAVQPTGELRQPNTPLKASLICRCLR